MQPPTIIHNKPDVASYTPLADYQASTPATFYDSKPVLHYHTENAYALIASEQLLDLPIFTGPESTARSATAINGKNIYKVALFVNSANLIIYSHDMKKGIEIPYPAITVHAIQRLNSNLTVTYDDGQAARHTLGPQSLYMQLDLSPPSDDDEFSDPVELILAPAINEADSSADSSVEAQQEEAVKALYAAVSACSNLHPDPVDEDDEEEDGLDDRIVFEGDAASFQSISGLPGAFTGVSDGGLPPPFPGSGGWITAENVDQFFDKDGNYIAATEDAEEEEQGGEQNEEGKRTNGTHEDADEQSAKRTRTE